MSEPKPSPTVHPVASADTLTATPTEPDPGTAEPIIERGSAIGRYVVLGKIGVGAMGVVFAAHDPDLDRKIAIKLLKSRDGESARIRMQREAQALAKLDHRNVVGVYDVGLHGDQLFLAMEFVEGQTLGAWMRSVELPHPWPEVLRVFMEAGRGLAAAHGAGLVHRDFKPDNVMIGKDGRVRVMDFGLARADGEGDLSVESSYRELRRTDRHALLETLTRTGVLVGTPAYMAPELFNGLSADASSDQFGFCVALYEALYGERPFAGPNVPALIRAVEKEQICEAPRHAKVPTWLRALVVRGLASDPQRRWPSMQALLDALASTPQKRRRKRWAVAGLAAAVGFGTATTLTSLDRQRDSTSGCAEYAERVQTVWNESISNELAEAFATRGELAKRSWPFVADELERWTTSWTKIDAELCERYGLGVAPELHERQLVCLDRALARFGSAVELLGGASAEELEHSFDVLARLPAPEACREAALVVDQPGVDPEQLAELERAVDKLELELELGRHKQADATSAELLSATNAPGFEELHMRVVETRISALVKLDRHKEAIDVAFSGLSAAERNGTAQLRLRAFVILADAHIQAQDLRGAERFLAQAKTIADESDVDRTLQRDLASVEAWILGVGGRLNEAVAAFDRALALTDPIYEPLVHAQITIARAHMFAYLGKAEEVLEQFDQVEREYVRLIGPDHPEMLELRIAKARISMRAGDETGAREEFLAATRALEALRGHPTTTTLSARAQAAWLLDRLGDCEGALAEYEPILPLAREQMPYPSPDLGDVLTRRSTLCHHRTPEAIDFAREALALYRAAVGDEHVVVASAHNQLARTLYEAGALASAREEVDAALAIYAAIHPVGAEFVDETKALSMLIRHGLGEPKALEGLDELLAKLPNDLALASSLAALR